MQNFSTELWVVLGKTDQLIQNEKLTNTNFKLKIFFLDFLKLNTLCEMSNPTSLK